MTRKQLLLRALICFVIAAVALLLMVRLSFAWHIAGTPWPENSCGEQVKIILYHIPDAVVVWGMIDMPDHPGHRQWHVQAYDPVKQSWLTIDQWHRITEHSEPEYNLFPRIEIPGEKWLEMIEKRERGGDHDRNH